MEDVVCGIRAGQWPVAQKVTTRWKVPVWFTPQHVFKGPYSVNSPVPARVLARTAVHVALGNECVLTPELLRTSWGTFLVYDYFGAVPCLERGSHSTTYVWEGIETWVLSREELSCVQIQAHNYVNIDAILPDLVFHFCLCFALQSGDAGPWNVLVDPATGRMAGIDMEDFRKYSIPASLFEALFTRGASRRVEKAVRAWLPAGGDALIARLNHALTCVPEQMPAECARSAEEVCTALSLLIVLVKSEINAILSASSEAKSKAKANVKKRCAVEELKNDAQVKRPKPNIYAVRSPAGHSFFTLASTLQKAIRRGEADVAVAALLDALAAGAPVHTAIQNRVLVIALEDIGIANWPLTISVVALMNRIAAATPAHSNDNPHRAELTGAVIAMAQSKKTRVLSLLYNAYCTDVGRAKMELPQVPYDFPAFLQRRDPRLLAPPAEVFNLHSSTGVKWWFTAFQAHIPGAVMQQLWQAYYRRRTCKDVRVFYLTPALASLYLDDTVRAMLPKEIQPGRTLTPLPVVIPEYAKDKHTLQGRGKGHEHFATHGALLVNEWNPPGLDVEQLKQVYLHVKQVADEKEKEKNVKMQRVDSSVSVV